MIIRYKNILVIIYIYINHIIIYFAFHLLYKKNDNYFQNSKILTKSLLYYVYKIKLTYTNYSNFSN